MDLEDSKSTDELGFLLLSNGVIVVRSSWPSPVLVSDISEPAKSIPLSSVS